jgi:Winged helix DNA-binding domain
VSGDPNRSHQSRVLSDRTLNRTLLARQQLLARKPGVASELIDRLVGLQAQAPLAPYVALWSRLDGFDASELSELLLARQYIRGHALRATLHLVSATDFPPLRALSEPEVARNLQAALAAPLREVDRGPVAAALRGALVDGPLRRDQLVDRLAGRWGDELASAAASAAPILTACVQAPPRGVWGRPGPVMWATAEQWLGVSLPSPPPSPAEYLARYLAAFGPATTADVRAWSGWRGLRSVVSQMRPGLRVFRDEEGRELYDVPDGLIADPDTPAPVRFLPEYDNVYFSFAHRARINPHRYAIPLAPGNGAAMGTFLADGIYAGTWRRTLRADGREATLTIEPYAPLTPDETDAVCQEGLALLAFLAPESTPEIQLMTALASRHRAR